MTRKCVLCKETNYKNTYSFFSAPKDPETRKKWQAAIGIENYSVSDDTYVCSKHFHKSDIITHWVSGVPPHVITIKYKKCRLRPGAVPGRNIHLQSNIENIEKDHSDLYDLNDFLTFRNSLVQNMDNKKENFLIPRKEPISNTDKEISEFRNHEYVYESTNRLTKVQSLKNESNINTLVNESRMQVKPLSIRSIKQDKTILSNNRTKFEVIVEADTILEKTRQKENNNYNQLPQIKVKRNTNISPNMFSYSEEDDTSAEMWEHTKIKNKSYIMKKCIDNTVNTNGNLYIENQTLNIVNNDHLDTYDDCMYDEIREHEILFEDLLEMCFEVALPRGWSCNVTSEGHGTTIVYLSMGMTKTGMPFLEKQVFIKSDMALRCSAVNQEIDPIMHNLVREGKNNKVQCLLDIEELVDEFDVRSICEGISDAENFQENNCPKIACKDGTRWRHVLCPLIVNNDSTRCSKCSMLCHLITHRFRESTSYNSNIILREQRKIHTRQRNIKRMKKRYTR